MPIHYSEINSVDVVIKFLDLTDESINLEKLTSLLYEQYIICLISSKDVENHYHTGYIGSYTNDTTLINPIHFSDPIVYSLYNIKKFTIQDDLLNQYNKIYAICMKRWEQDLYTYIDNVHYSHIYDNTIVNYYTIAIIFKQIIKNVQFLHQNNITHMDIALENVLYNSYNNRVVLCDFGLSRVVNCNHEIYIGKCGRNQYMSQEMFEHGKCNMYKNDIFSCGVLLFTMLTGLSLFDTTRSLLCYRKHMSTLKKFTATILYWKLFIPTPILQLIYDMIQPERYRLSLSEILSHPFLNATGTHNEYLRSIKNTVVPDIDNDSKINTDT